MHDSLSLVFEIILTGLIVLNIFRAFFSKDKSEIWSPIVAISLTYIYYVLVPFWMGTIDKYLINESDYNGYLFHLAALISYVSIMLGFMISINSSFKKWNSLINSGNAGKYGLIIFLIGIVGYSSVRGFHFTIGINPNAAGDLSVGGFVYYFMMMRDMLPFASALLLLKLKVNWKNLLYLIPFWFIFVQFIVAGARWRIVVSIIALLAANYLFPKAKKINLFFVSVIAILVFMGFSAMDKARIRGQGIDMSIANDLSYADIKSGAEENYSVYWFSVLCMNQINKSKERIYFEPVFASICMPFPRALFPRKPDASYLKDIEKQVGSSGGSAYLNFVENYFSFGWFGVVFWGLFLGWLARVFWDNYKNNRNSIGAIVALGVFCGFCFVAISRGYLPATFTTFILAICLPFWIISILKRFEI